ncbi:cyclic-phosphate processing receiver domain-containing protein [Pedosphaera parvula]|uniref:Cyclic-phosphate processing Receiver domain-containing protein n=1 Tax=Pedosphaera parvula (strain Ellin514) TaxID=320771 RepID=B9XFJ8_PEDPL|nr:cyclic-phosphate processing receiver domain-containing protein [Pedosphaera parvula]EEF61362.1 hypothetical protein Cflav_PD4383 [Pedosphaera parvula Ellin514]
MARNTILILEDNDDRIAGFHAAIASLDSRLNVKLWYDAPTMIKECSQFLDAACLFSLDHDLNPRPGASEDPGTGLDVAEYLCTHVPVCSVLLHSTNYERVWSMHNEFRFAGWQVDRVGPIGEDWIPKLWLPVVRKILSSPLLS